MNRILIGSSINNIGVIKNNKIIIDIKENTNILIKENDLNEYVFNVFSSNLNILCINNDKNKTFYEINVNKGTVSFNSISFTGNDIDMKINLNSEDSSVFVHNSLVAKRYVNCNIKVNHNCKNTISDIKNNAVTINDGTVKFYVTSYAPKKSKYCKINQDSKIISLNEVNENEINPVLLIDEFETEAKHAAFIGNFNENILFYLMSRGLDEDKSKTLLINGLLIGTLDICFNEKEQLKKKLNDEWR